MATATVSAPRFKALYQESLRAQLQESLELPNVMQVPRLEKIVINMGVGAAVQQGNLLEHAVRDLTAISGQKPIITRAKKSIAGFKLREGNPIGCKVTLRGARMYEFLDRLVSLAVPRIRDFRGLPPKAFDGRGNYTFGVTEQLIFPEIDYDKVDVTRGMDITIVTTARTDAEGKALLLAFDSRSDVKGSSNGQKALRNKQAKTPKFKVRGYTRCRRCGRPRSVFRKFNLCRICLRELAHAGELPGVTKASW